LRVANVITIGPESYRRWRSSRLGRVTDALEDRLILELAGMVEGKRILDVGCGDGAFLVSLVSRGGRVTGLDVDSDMLAAARWRLDTGGLQAEMYRGEAGALPFPTASFDLVTAVTVLCFADDTGRVIRELARVLRPGGRLVLGDLGRWNLWAVQRRLKGWLGSRTWAAASFRSVRQLQELVAGAGLLVETSRGAIFYPPCGWCARILAPFDDWIGRRTTAGAAFIAIAATKPIDHQGAPAQA
jgi:ubiquinone/menaquinone biosynthesis C-methylase UbiE